MEKNKTKAKEHVSIQIERKISLSRSIIKYKKSALAGWRNIKRDTARTLGAESGFYILCEYYLLRTICALKEDISDFLINDKFYLSPV